MVPRNIVQNNPSLFVLQSLSTQFSHNLFCFALKEEERIGLFYRAAENQTNVMVNNILGQGIDIHLLGLRELSREHHCPDGIAVFDDPSYKDINHFSLSTSQVRDNLGDSWRQENRLRDWFLRNSRDPSFLSLKKKRSPPIHLIHSWATGRWSLMVTAAPITHKRVRFSFASHLFIRARLPARSISSVNWVRS